MSHAWIEAPGLRSANVRAGEVGKTGIVDGWERPPDVRDNARSRLPSRNSDAILTSYSVEISEAHWTVGSPHSLCVLQEMILRPVGFARAHRTLFPSYTVIGRLGGH